MRQGQFVHRGLRTMLKDCAAACAAASAAMVCDRRACLLDSRADASAAAAADWACTRQATHLKS